ncbi:MULTISPECIES: VCBS repeat-containing protein, partial [Micromonospora]|uniref:FG-GAP repeat domain-containing protein n=1 Tax=Micromonospora TaxID=1873 RepID=UPI0013D667E1
MRVEVLDRAVAQKAGVAGLLLRVYRVDGDLTPGPVSIDVDASGFAAAFGGDWASRLRLFRFPACVRTTPGAAGCGNPTLVSTSAVNNRTGVLSAQVDVGPEALVTSDPVERKMARLDGVPTAEPDVFAVMAAGASSDTGDFTKTPFAASYQWQAGNSGAGFSWSYDMDVPPVPGELDPEISLGYSSGAVDGQTAGKNVQPGAVGEGWDLSAGFIERSYRTCADDTANSPYYTNATADQCWRLPNARLVWGGKSTELVPDDATGAWHAADDDGLRVEKVTADWLTANLMFSPGDWNGDGKADVLYRRSSDGKLFMVRGDGAGGFLNGGAAVQIGSFTSAATIFSPGDWDGDGKPDLLWRKASDGTMWLIAGNGTGGWKTGSSVQIGTGWNGMDQIFSPGDFDGDGKSDVISRNASTHNLYLYKGNGSGGWLSGSGAQIASGPASADIIFSGGDFDGDGKPDVLWRQASSKDVFLLAGNGIGGWKTGQSVNVTAPVRTGTGDDEYWKVTTTDGTQYFFGRSRLPSWTSGKRETLSQWTVPVFANHSGEPCFTTAGFASSYCNQAWRWNLDYVVDRHGNSMAYFYDRERAKVGLNGNASTVSDYDRGGRLVRVEYGMRAGSELATTTPPAQVTFSYAERCLSSCWSGTTWASSPTTANWPDTPWDLDCTAAPCSSNLSPSFWTSRRLTGVTTQVWSGSGTTYNTVDQWDFTHQFPSTGNGTSPVLWLASITHTGKANGGSIALPSVTFGGTRFDQRADYDPNGTMAQPRKYRITTVSTETGGQLA